MEPTFYRSDSVSMSGHYYQRPDELISFHDLLFRWHTVSFFTIPFFTVLRKKDDLFGFYLHLFKAESIVFQGNPSKDMDDAEAMRIKLIWQPPFYFNVRYDALFKDFDLLYFRRAEVEEIEEAYPECLITDAGLREQDEMYETTAKNIRKVAALTLWRMAISDQLPVEHPTSFKDGFRSPDSPAFWRKEDAPLPPICFLEIFRSSLGANIPVTIPERAKKKHNNKLDDFKPAIKALRNMGIRVDKKCAKILYSLYPHLTQEELGKLFPAKAGTKRSNATDRDRGRVLLGLKSSRKPPKGKGKSTT